MSHSDRTTGFFCALILFLFASGIAAADEPIDNLSPTAVLVAPAMVAYGSDIEVSGARSFDTDGSIVGYIWRLDSGQQVETASPSHVFDINPDAPLAPGRHNISLVVVDDAGAHSSADVAQVIVADGVAPTAVVDVDAVIPAGSPVEVSGQHSFDVGGTIVEYRWTLDSRPPVVTADPVHVFPLDADNPLSLGIHTVTLVVTDDSGNQSTPDSAQFIVSDTMAPTAVITGPERVPYGRDISVSGSRSFDVGGAIRVWRWSIDGQAPVVTDTPEHTFAFDAGQPFVLGTHIVQLVVVDDSGNVSAPDQVQVLVVDSVAPTAVITAPDTVPVGQSFTVSGVHSFDPDGHVREYRWTVGTRPVVVTPDPLFTVLVNDTNPLPVGPLTVQLVVVDDQGNLSQPDMVRVVVVDEYAPTAVLTAPHTVPYGQDIAVSGARSFDMGGTIAQYEWTLDGSAVVVTHDPSHTFGFDPASPFAVGRHTVQLVVTDQAGLRSLPDAVEVVVTDDTAPTAVIDAPAQVNCGSDIPVSGEGSFDVGGRIVQYEWRLDDGAPVVTDVPSYTYPPNPCTPSLLGPHTVQLVVTDDTGNVSSPVFAEVVVGDGTPPSIELTTPGEGAVYLLNQAVAARFTCDDMESGIASCAGTLANGEAVDTSMVGTKTFTVTAVDAAGNEQTVSHTYRVQYASSGFLPPIDNLPTTNTGTAGRTFPVKWRLADASGAPLTSVSTFASLTSSPVACDGSPDSPIEEQLTASDGGGLRYDAQADQFIYNWQTSRSWRGCRLLQVTLTDGTRLSAKFQFR